MLSFGNTPRAKILIVLRASLLLLAGINFACGGGSSSSGSSGATSPTFPFVYVTNEADNTVTEYRVNTAGALQLIGSVQTGRRPGGIITTTTDTEIVTGDPSGMVFVLNRDDNTISQYYIQGGQSASPGL